MQEMLFQSLVREDPLEEKMITHLSIFPPWEIPWTEEPGRLQSMGLQRVRHDLVTKQRQQQTFCKMKCKRLCFLRPKMKARALAAQSCLTVCDPMDYRPPGSSVCGILQARILEWVAISFSRGSSESRNRTWVSPIAGRAFTI